MKICYTAIINDYDTLQIPLIIDPNWIYLCFTTNRNLTSNFWKIIYVDLSNDPIRQARKIKIIPNFSIEYTHYLWIDANIQIKTSLDEFITPLLDFDINVMNHPDRQNLFQEALAITRLRKDDKMIVFAQLNDYQNQLYNCNELCATGILFRHNNDLVKKHALNWYNEILKHSHRDQMSFNFACWKSNIKPNYFSYNCLRGINFNHYKHLKKVII